MKYLFYTFLFLINCQLYAQVLDTKATKAAVDFCNDVSKTIDFVDEDVKIVMVHLAEMQNIEGAKEKINAYKEKLSEDMISRTKAQIKLLGSEEKREIITKILYDFGTRMKTEVAQEDFDQDPSISQNRFLFLIKEKMQQAGGCDFAAMFYQNFVLDSFPGYSE